MTAEPRLPNVGDLIDRGKYRIDALVGEGGMGVVFAATHMQMGGKRRAIKWLQPSLAREEQAVRRFLSEANIASRIDHVNVVSPIDVSVDPSAPYIVMELLEGETLNDFLGDQMLPLEKAGRIFMPILQGVAAAHDQNIVHRDLKPGNIFLAQWSGGSGRIPKVLDFGIAKVMDARATAGTLTNQGALLGTIQYMSPEQLQNASEVGPQTDIYALGVILYRMLTARMPYEGNLLDLALRIREGRPAPLSSYVANLPSGFDEVVLRALSPSLQQRYADVRSFAHALSPYFPQHGLDFSPALRASRPSPISELPPGGAPPVTQPIPRPQRVDPPRGSSAPKEVSTFHPVATKSAPSNALRARLLLGIAGAVLLGGAVAAVIAWPSSDDGYDDKEGRAEDTHVVEPAPKADLNADIKAAAAQPAPAAPAPAQPAAADPAAARDAAAAAAEPTPGWNNIGDGTHPTPTAPTPAAEPAVDRPAPPPARREEAAAAGTQQDPRRDEERRQRRPREDPSPNAPSPSTLDILLEQPSNKRLDTILESNTKPGSGH